MIYNNLGDSLGATLRPMHYQNVKTCTGLEANTHVLSMDCRILTPSNLFVILQMISESCPHGFHGV